MAITVKLTHLPAPRHNLWTSRSILHAVLGGRSSPTLKGIRSPRFLPAAARQDPAHKSWHSYLKSQSTGANYVIKIQTQKTALVRKNAQEFGKRAACDGLVQRRLLRQMKTFLRISPRFPAYFHGLRALAHHSPHDLHTGALSRIFAIGPLAPALSPARGCEHATC